MAVAEARAVWQRTANRCFVQEDAKRAPKLACCQSSSTSKQVDSGPATATEGPDHPAVGFMPLNTNPSYSSLPPDTRWWLHKQPSCQKGFTYEQLNTLENGGTKKAGVVNSTSRISEAHKSKGEKNNEFFVGVHNGSVKKASELGKKNVKALDGKDIEELIELEDSTDSWEMMQVDPVDCSDTKQSNEMCFDPEYSWIGSEKSEPWWRMTDTDELVSLVARKSLDRVENCDLPPPQKMSHRRHPYARVGCFDNKEISASSFDWRTQTGSLSSNETIRSQGFGDSGRTQEVHGCLTAGVSPYECDETSRNSYSTTHKNITEIQQDCEGEFSKAQLMEALCHSQTRAREAEKVAKQAYAEREHIVALFFKQASLLFAYKQWFQLLQPETLCIQFNSDQQSTVPSPVLPWLSSCEDRKPRKSLHKGVKGRGEKRGPPDHDVAKYAYAFALGLSLVGAGLLLGWTVGWMLPPF